MVMITRWLVLLYGVASYVLFLGVFLYAVGFIVGFGTPTTLDGTPTMAWPAALAINVGLLGLFALQHSGMARPAFKHWLTRLIPTAAERSTYVLASNVALIALFSLWQPLGGTIWNVTDPIARGVIYGLAAFGWLTVLVTTFLLNHFELFGLRQVWLNFIGMPYTHLPFKTPGPYAWVRHPLYIGWLTAFWATPTMTVAHLLFAVGTTVYILMAIRWEERDLCDALPEYSEYRRHVPMLIPRWKKRPTARPVDVLGQAWNTSITMPKRNVT
jgi:protein-S-isoprenylcysteine O-methyltransferase Ste14